MSATRFSSQRKASNMRTITITAIDDPEGTTYVLAEDWATQGIRRRLPDEFGPVVIHPTEEDVFILGPGNFWDGPMHIRWDADLGHFFSGTWGGPIHWPLIGPIN